MDNYFLLNTSEDNKSSEKPSSVTTVSANSAQPTTLVKVDVAALAIGGDVVEALLSHVRVLGDFDGGENE